MAYTIRRVDVWAVDVVNRPGMLARVLEALTWAGAELEFVIARQVSANTSRVFVAPVTGKEQTAAAGDVGLVPAKGMSVLRIEGPNRTGLAAHLTRSIAGAGLNLRGVSAASVGKRSVIYLALATQAEAERAAEVAKFALSGAARPARARTMVKRPPPPRIGASRRGQTGKASKASKSKSLKSTKGGRSGKAVRKGTKRR